MGGRTAIGSGGQEASSYRPDPGRGMGVPGSGDPSEIERPFSRDPIVWAIAFLALFTAGVTVWWASGIGDASLSNQFVGAESAPAGVIVVFMAMRLRRTARLDPRVRRAWSIIAVGLLVYGLGLLVRLAAGSTPTLGFLAPLAIGLGVALYPLMSVALSLLPRPAKTRYDLMLFSLDVTVAAASAAILLWHFSIFPTARDNGQDALAAVVAAFFPVYDAALVFSIAAIVVRGLPESTRAALIIAGFAISAIFAGDLMAGLATLQRTYSGGGMPGFLYSVAWIALATASYAQWRVKDRKETVGGLAGYSRSFPWLPYVAVAVAFVAPAMRDWNEPDMLRQHVPATGFLIALVVARLAVTARQNASLAAAERERLAAAVDQAAEAMLTTDRDGNITYVNPGFTRITGYPKGEALGRNPEFLVHATDGVLLSESTSALNGGESWQGRVPHRRRDGTIVELDVAVAPLRDANGAASGSVWVARDNSRERGLEAQLAQAQRMEAIGRLAGGIAHDFNNILTAIGGFSELAAAEVPGDHPVAADIEQIRKAADRAAALTRSLLAFSRRQILQSRLIDLNDVVAGLTPMLGRLIGADVQLVVRMEPDLGVTMADGAQLEQVLLNLTVNARDAMPHGGILTIATANVDLDAGFVRANVAASEGKYVVLIVTDTGTGMARTTLEHAFEPFFTTKEQGKGTGLGLSTAVGIVQQTGGFVLVESAPNMGSTFSVYLPRLEGVTRPDEAAASADLPPGGTETILVAEDETAVRKLVERVLTGAGYRVRAAPHGEAAIELAKAMPDLDLLLTDVVMPGMNGIQLAAHLTRVRPGLPVIFASGYSHEGVPRGAGKGGKASYLPKPFTADNLLVRIREVLDQAAPAAAGLAERDPAGE